MRPIIVFDTNVLFSGIGWRGTPYQCLDLGRCGKIDCVTCHPILDELTGKLLTKLHQSPEQIAATINDLLDFHRLIHIEGKLHGVVPDPDDDKVLECAMSANATHLVTGDRRHLLPLQDFRGIAIVTPGEFLKVIEAWRQDDLP